MGFCDRIWHYGRSLLICILRLSNYYAMFLSTKSDVKEKSKEPFTFRGIISLIINNARLHRRNLCRNSLILVSCILLFGLNTVFLKGVLIDLIPQSFFTVFSICYFNDVLGGISFLAYTNILIWLIHPSIEFTRLIHVIIFIGFCGVFWEYAAPAFIKYSTTDPLDICAYVTGGVIYWGIINGTKLVHEIIPKCHDNIS